MNNSTKNLSLRYGEETIGSLSLNSKIELIIKNIFESIGYSQWPSLEIDTIENNFDKLNIPFDHPSRKLSDTFYIKNKFGYQKEYLLRTHATNFQSSVINKISNNEMIKAFSIGKVYRNDYEDSTHLIQYNNLDVFCIGKKISLSNLFWTLNYFISNVFNDFNNVDIIKNDNVRIRNSYFPFTEPSYEIDIKCVKCNLVKSCNLCLGSGWVEVLGAGMIHPNVLKNNEVDSEIFSGFAFGVGVERLLMIKYSLNDIRKINDINIRNLKKYKNIE